MTLVYGEAQCLDKPAQRADCHTTADAAPKTLGFPGGVAADGCLAPGDLALAARSDHRSSRGYVRRSLGSRHVLQDLARVMVRPRRRIPIRPHFSVAVQSSIARDGALDGRNLHDLPNTTAVVHLPVRISHPAPAAAGTAAVEAVSAGPAAVLLLGSVGWSHRVRHSTLRTVPARLVCGAAAAVRSRAPGMRRCASV